MTTRMNSDNQIEIVEKGVVVEVEKCKRKRRKDGTVRIKLPKNLQVVINKEGKKILVPTGVKYPWSQEVADTIVMMIMEGCTMAQITAVKEMPPLSIIYRWARKYPEFKSALKEARADRAEHFHDKALDVANNGKGTKKEKLQVNTLQWAAEKGDPGTYAGKSEGGTTIVNIMIDTGINRGEKEVPCEVKVNPVEEKSDAR